jgi:hypothetical protein
VQLPSSSLPHHSNKALCGAMLDPTKHHKPSHFGHHVLLAWTLDISNVVKELLSPKWVDLMNFPSKRLLEGSLPRKALSLLEKWMFT